MSLPFDPPIGLTHTPVDLSQPEGGWKNPKGGYLFFAGLASSGAAMASLTPAVLTLTLKAKVIDPVHATSILSVVVGIAGLAGLVAFPILGRLSDRTLSRLGRRRPYLLFSSVLFLIGMVLIVTSTSVPTLILGQVVNTIGYSATLVAVTATIADQVEPGRRGPVSAVVGLCAPVGVLIGLFLAQLVSSSLTLEIVLPSLFGIVGPAVLAARLSDRRLLAADRPKFDLAQLGSTFWVSPRKHPNFAWAFGSRFLIYFGIAALQAYQVFYLLSVLHFSPQTVAGAVFLTTLVLTGVSLVVAPISAKISDIIGRRKPFVAASAVVFGVGLLLAALSQSFGAFMIATAVVGIGQGVYLAVDVALVTQVLPDVNNTGKDLGLMNLANTLPLAIVPLLAPAILAVGATATMPQNYAFLFLLGAVAGIVGAILILPIRRIR